ncbi:MAG: DEAD/DEAH box helicase [Hyphomicrobiaceae bacterium]|nr:DEAD/DEAH box helicase [Hyphomicrobiaceae bacterium]
MTQFTDLGLAAPILKALAGEGYTTPTPIQAKAVPAVLAGSDLLGIAQTGTGKTAAFALPILHRLAADRRSAPRKGCRVLVLAPTRELASQIAESFRTYGRHLRLSVTVVFGGVGHRPQIQALAGGVDILIATPGRLIDHMGARAVSLQETEVLVLDEADRMLDMGFVKPIRQIVSHLPARRQTLLFSATMPQEIAALAAAFLRDPVKVAVTPVASTVERVIQRVIHIESQKKRALLADLLSDPGMSRALVFTRTKRGADRVAKHLETAGIRVAAIHGNKSQRQRELALDDFRNAKIRVLVATDIAARGIDVDGVSHVVNYELPEVPEDYVHRIGRTARAGASGSAISLCDAAERSLLRDIERLTRQSIAAEDRRGDAGLAADAASGRERQGSPGAGRSGEQRWAPRPSDRNRPRTQGAGRDGRRPARRASA